MSVNDKDVTFAHIVEGICDVIKKQPWIVAVYRSLERQMYYKYVNNRQREGPEVQCRLIKIIAYIFGKVDNSRKKGDM